MGNDNSAGVLSQDEIDRLLSAGNDDTAEEATETASESDFSGSSGVLSQEAIDSLINSGGADGNDDGSETPNETDSAAGTGVLSQEEIDSLMNSGGDGKNEKDDPGSQDETELNAGAGMLSQQAIDALVNSGEDDGNGDDSEAQGESDSDAGAGMLSQEEIDELMNSGDGQEEDAGTEPADEAESASEAGVLSQDEIDELMKAGESGDEEPGPEDSEDTVSVLTQEDLDDLLSDEIGTDMGSDSVDSGDAVDPPQGGGNGLLSDNDMAILEAYQKLKGSGKNSVSGKNKKAAVQEYAGNQEEENEETEEIQLLNQEDLDDLLPDSAIGDFDEETVDPEISDPEDNDPVEESSTAPQAVDEPNEDEIDQTIAMDPPSFSLGSEGEEDDNPDDSRILPAFTEVAPRRSGWRKAAVSLIAASVIAACGAVSWYYGSNLPLLGRLMQKLHRKAPAEITLMQPQQVAPLPVSSQSSSAQPEQPVEPKPATKGPVQPAAEGWDERIDMLPEPLKQRIQEAGNLRQTVLEKQAQFEKLQAYYREGIETVKKNLLKELASGTWAGPETVPADPRTRMNLHIIQRRRAYIKQLESLSQDLISAGEELLYLKRKALINALMAPATGGYDHDSLATYVHALVQTHASDLENMGFEADASAMEPLSAIWRIIRTESAGSDPPDTLPPTRNTPPSARVAEVTETAPDGSPDEICDGLFDKKYLLTELSVPAADCLTAWNGTDLVLNNLTHLSADAAKHLSRWKGEWLCLNGFTELSPDTARHLFQWQGDRLSLNGLRKLTPEVARLISRWRGKQLELVGLTELSFEVAESLVSWQKAGGTLYVPEHLKSTPKPAKVLGRKADTRPDGRCATRQGKRK